MSERIYLTCHSHNPPLRSDEVGYKHYLPTIRAALFARGGMSLTDELTDFIAAHPHCDVQIVGEYGDVYYLDDERIQAVQYLVDTGSIAAPVLTEHDKGYNLALQHVKEALGGESDD